VVHLALRSFERPSLGIELGLVLGKLILHFGDVYNREHLTRLHVIADINANIGQVAGDLSEEIGFLEGCERCVGLQPLYHREAARIAQPRLADDYPLSLTSMAMPPRTAGRGCPPR